MSLFWKTCPDYIAGHNHASQKGNQIDTLHSSCLNVLSHTYSRHFTYQVEQTTRIPSVSKMKKIIFFISISFILHLFNHKHSLYISFKVSLRSAINAMILTSYLHFSPPLFSHPLRAQAGLMERWRPSWLHLAAVCLHSSSFRKGKGIRGNCCGFNVL